MNSKKYFPDLLISWGVSTNLSLFLNCQTIWLIWEVDLFLFWESCSIKSVPGTMEVFNFICSSYWPCIDYTVLSSLEGDYVLVCPNDLYSSILYYPFVDLYMYSCLEGKSKCQTGGKSKRTIQGTHKNTKQVQHIQLFTYWLLISMRTCNFSGFEYCIFCLHAKIQCSIL